MDNRPIGVFDSGVGGLTVVSQIIKTLPNEKIIYFGDTARVPYGNKSIETVTKFSLQNLRFLEEQDVKTVIVACNTSSSNSLETLKASTNIPVMGVVEAGVKASLLQTKNKKIGIIGTERTITSGAYEKLILQDMPDANVFSKACPLFVPFAEEGLLDSEITSLGARYYLDELINKNVDSIVLGCTHYPLLKNCLQKVCGTDIYIVDPAEMVSIELKNLLEKEGLLCAQNSKSEKTFYVSDNTSKFEFICELALQEKYTAKIIDIEKY